MWNTLSQHINKHLILQFIRTFLNPHIWRYVVFTYRKDMKSCNLKCNLYLVTFYHLLIHYFTRFKGHLLCFYFLSFPSVFYIWSCACKTLWKLKRSKSTPTVAHLWVTHISIIYASSPVWNGKNWHSCTAVVRDAGSGMCELTNQRRAGI